METTIMGFFRFRDPVKKATRPTKTRILTAVINSVIFPGLAQQVPWVFKANVQASCHMDNNKNKRKCCCKILIVPGKIILQVLHVSHSLNSQHPPL